MAVSPTLETRQPGETFTFSENPLIRDAFTADPAAIVVGDTLYLYSGHDEAKPTDNRFIMRNWRLYSTRDMKTWTFEGTPLDLSTFKWADRDAWASQVVQKDGKFYFFTCTHQPGQGMAIGVAVSDSPKGPFVDAIGKPLITNSMTKQVPISWDDLDPTVWIEEDGTPYLIWGNQRCKIVKLKPNMTELDGDIQVIDLPEFTEAPWIHKYQGKYYLSYAHKYPETIAYATAEKITGPYTFESVIVPLIADTRTSHQAIVEFKGNWWFFYHSAALSKHEYRRSVCVDQLEYDAGGKIKPILRTGLDASKEAHWPPPASRP